MAKDFALIFLTTEDVYADYERLKSRGSGVLGGSRGAPVRRFHDPSGNGFRLSQASELSNV